MTKHREATLRIITALAGSIATTDPKLAAALWKLVRKFSPPETFH